MKWFLCQRHDIQPRESWTVGLASHLQWMREQHLAGHVVMSGPAPGRGMSMYLIRAASYEVAREIADADPYTQAGQCEYVLIEWAIHQIMGAGSFVPTT